MAVAHAGQRLPRLGTVAETVRRRRDGDPAPWLGVLAALTDLAVNVVTWGIALGSARGALVPAAGCVLALGAQGRYRTAHTAIDVGRICRAVVAGGALVVVGALAGGMPVHLPSLVVGVLASLAMLAAIRTRYGRWLLRERAAGRYLRPVVVVTAGTVAPALLRMTAEHPEAGLRIAGVVDPSLATASAIASADASGAIVIVDDVPAERLDGLLEELLDAELDVYVASGLDHGPALVR